MILNLLYKAESWPRQKIIDDRPEKGRSSSPTLRGPVQPIPIFLSSKYVLVFPKKKVFLWKSCQTGFISENLMNVANINKKTSKVLVWKGVWGCLYTTKFELSKRRNIVTFRSFNFTVWPKLLILLKLTNINFMNSPCHSD